MSRVDAKKLKRWEASWCPKLTPGLPWIARLDGKGFHQLTADCERPWDARFHRCMSDAALELCRRIPGVRLAYLQSDEITLIIRDDDKPWFDGELTKLCSISAGWASARFAFSWIEQFSECKQRVVHQVPAFDARFYTVPEPGIVETLIWRQEDATRNSLLALARAHFSHELLLGKSEPQLHELLHTKEIHWGKLPVTQKRGRCVVRAGEHWEVDDDIPVFAREPHWILQRTNGMITSRR